MSCEGVRNREREVRGWSEREGKGGERRRKIEKVVKRGEGCR